MDMSFHNMKRNKARRNESAYDVLITDPEDFGTQFVPLANVEMAFTFDEDLDDGEFIAYVFGPTTRQINVPAMVAGTVFRFGWVEKDFRIAFSSSVTGNMTLYIVRSNGVLASIGTGVID